MNAYTATEIISATRWQDKVSSDIAEFMFRNFNETQYLGATLGTTPATLADEHDSPVMLSVKFAIGTDLRSIPHASWTPVLAELTSELQANDETVRFVTSVHDSELSAKWPIDGKPRPSECDSDDCPNVGGPFVERIDTLTFLVCVGEKQDESSDSVNDGDDDTVTIQSKKRTRSQK